MNIKSLSQFPGDSFYGHAIHTHGMSKVSIYWRQPRWQHPEPPSCWCSHGAAVHYCSPGWA